MQEFFSSKLVAVTGASGFIGSNIVRQLISHGADVRAIVEPKDLSQNLKGLPIECIEADIRDFEKLKKSLKDVNLLFHTAALYSFWHPNPNLFYEVNVQGTINVLRAAEHLNVDKVIYTSTVATFGIDKADINSPANEESYANIDHLFGHYKKSKYVAEHEVLRRCGEGQNITLVHPTTPVGYGDIRPTPTGQFILDFLNGKMPGYVDTVLNIVNVKDVALGHLLAAAHGKKGRSYILGGENLYMKDILTILSQITGITPPKLKVPRVLTTTIGFLSTYLEPAILKRPPTVALEAVKMSTTKMAFDSQRAAKELSYKPESPEDALYEAVKYFLSTDKVKSDRKSLIKLKPLKD